ncbi:MAG: hypothetical protein ABIB79_02990 [archaeon]
MEKFQENLQKAQRIIQTVDHMAYMTFQLVKDKRLLLKMLTEIKNGISSCINAILQYEYLYKRISLYKNARENFMTFEKRCAKRYNITEEEINLIKNLFDIVEKHNQSPFEFMRGDKVVILSNGLQPQTITIEEVKRYLLLAKSICRKAKVVIFT